MSIVDEYVVFLIYIWYILNRGDFYFGYDYMVMWGGIYFGRVGYCYLSKD